jgi:hypothetical protein
MMRMVTAEVRRGNEPCKSTKLAIKTNSKTEAYSPVFPVCKRYARDRSSQKLHMSSGTDCHDKRALSR